MTNWNKRYIPAKQTYDTLVCPNGYGHSGSGTVLDFLSEFDTTTVFGYHDFNAGTEAPNSLCVGEMDFYRRTVLPLLWRERNNENILRFISAVEYLYVKGGELYNDEYYRLSREFVNDLVLGRTESKEWVPAEPWHSFKEGLYECYENLECPFLNKPGKSKYVYTPRCLNNDEFMDVAGRYVSAVLGLIDSKSFLVCDQFVSCNIPFDYHVKCLGNNLKVIRVYRDPRDIYATGVKYNIPWIARDVDAFIKQYQPMLKSLEIDHPNSITVRFEDFIFDYANISKQICDFIGLDPKDHIFPKRYFDPSKSVKNVALWKKVGSSSVYGKIEEMMRDVCFYGELH